MERQKEERKRMIEERGQKKEEQKDWRNEKTNNAPVSTRLLRRFPDLMVPIPVIALIGWNRQKHWSMNTNEEYTEKSCYSTVAPVYPRPSAHYLKGLQTNKLKIQYYKTIPTLKLFHNAPMHTNSYTRNLMKLYRHTTPGTHCTSILPTPTGNCNPLSRMYCIHYASSLYGKLSDEMTGKFNQDLPENLHTAFQKAVNFEPYIITKQSINERKVHDINHIDVTPCQDEIEINEAHIWNPNCKGKNYDPNYQQNKNKQNFNNISSNPETKYQNNGNQGQGNHYTKSNHQEKPVNVSVTLNGPVSKEQLYKIQEVLRHPSQYRDRLKPEDQPATDEYTKSFNKFHPKKVEVNEATIEEAIKFGQYLKRSKEDIAKVIDIYVMHQQDCLLLSQLRLTFPPVWTEQGTE